MANTLMWARLRSVPVLLAAVTGQVLLWEAGAGAAMRVADTVGDPRRRSDTTLTGPLVVDVATTLMLIAGTWLVLATVMTVVTQIAPAPLRRRCPTLAPRPWRRFVVSLLGTGVLAVPLVVTGTAGASDSHAVSGERVPAPGNPLRALDGLPYPDRPTTPTARRPGAARPAVVVRPGDSLWSLVSASDPAATDADIARRWPRWYAANRELIGPDPDLLQPGTVLHPPEQP